MTLLDTATDIINALGGNQSVARLTGVTHKAVSNWRGFGRFPPDTYLLIKTALAELGHSAPNHLWSMREAPPQKKRRA